MKKIILTEQQLKLVISELTDRRLMNHKYLNDLLDKVGKGGYESLSDKEKEDLSMLSAGKEPEKLKEPQKMKKPESVPKQEIDPDIWDKESTTAGEDTSYSAYAMFMDIVFDTNITVNGERWRVNVIDDDQYESDILLTHVDDVDEGGFSFIATPYKHGNSVYVKIPGKVETDIPFDRPPPRNPQEVDEFYEQFFRIVLPGLIKRIYR